MAPTVRDNVTSGQVSAGRAQGPYVHALIRAQASRRPDAAAIAVSGREPLPYALLGEQVGDVARFLREVGIRRGHRVALVLPQGPELAVASIAISAVTACVPLHPGYSAREHERYLTTLAVDVLLLAADQPSPARSVAQSRGIPVIDLVSVSNAPAGIFRLTASGPFAQSDPPDSITDAAYVMHTSGTTSRPKIVPLTHANIAASVRNISRTLSLTESDRCLSIMPLFHIHGLMGVLSSLASGSTVLFPSSSDGAGFFRALEELQPTWYSAVPTTHHAILAQAPLHLDTIRCRPLRFIRSSSSALPRQVGSELERVFRAPVLEAYGMTEACHQIASNPLPPETRRPGSVGPPAGPEVAVVDERGCRLPPGETGEIVIRGDNVIRAYEGDDAVNATAFRDGWLRTGDQGFEDAAGYLFLTGRSKEMISRGGQKIAPTEIDEVLGEHPSVRQAASFAIPHPTLGEEVAAAITLRQSTSATEAEIRQFAAKRLADHKVPRRVFFVDSLPLGESGKVQRASLAHRLAPLASDATRRAPAGELVRPRDMLERQLVALWEELLQIHPIGTGDDFFELGGDSLLAADMMDRVQQACGHRVALTALFDAATVEHLASIIRTGAGAEPRPRIVTVQPGSARRPLFFLHGDWGGGGFYCAALAKGLGPDQPFHALAPHAVDGGSVPRSIEAMAADNLEPLLAHEARRPLRLGGYCNGALVALEMAHLLRARNVVVDLLILVQPPPIGRPLPVRLLHRAVLMLSTLYGLGPDERADRFLTWIHRARRLVARLPGGTAPGARGTTPPVRVGLSRERARYLDTQHAYHRRAMAAYLPRRYDGRVALIWGRDYVDRLRRRSGVHPASAWSRVTPRLSVHLTPGDHLTVVTKHARALADVLRMCLETSPD